jgi:flagellar biosynthetic protein FliP
MSMAAVLRVAALGLLAATGLLAGADAFAATAAPSIALPGFEVKVAPAGGREEVALAVKILVGLTVITLAPAILVSVTSFVRIVIVLSMLRHAFGMQETPPNTVLISLALFLTLFTMAPVLHQVNDRAFQPYMEGKISTEQALSRGMSPLRDFMVRQTREQDLALMVELSRSAMPRSIDDVSNVQLIPAFMLTELRAAFQIGFVVFLPFLLIDLIVSSILMALGMMMVPPATISLPIKILMFVLIDGWNLVIRAVVGTIL